MRGLLELNYLMELVRDVTMRVYSTAYAGVFWLF